MSGVVNDAKTGTPISTMRPSCVEVERRIIETTSHATMAPMKRAKTSYAPPMRMASAATVLTMSPEGISSVSAVPVEAIW